MLDGSTSADREAGLIAGRFETLRSLGEGSFAIVYEAVDRTLDRRVALKLFNGYAPGARELALREARAMAQLNHEHVLLVHDVGLHRDVPYLACEYADTDLRRWLAGAERSPHEILQRYREAGLGLAAAHRAGLVHHDFKPANVLLRADGSAAIGDFGLARHLDSQDGDASVAGAPDGCAFGTLMYIAPERLVGEPGDARSDQFSFCVALWEGLAGEHPFVGADAQRRYDSIAAGPSGAPKAEAHVVRALRRGLALDPSSRFADMDALLDALAPSKRTDVRLMKVPRITVMGARRLRTAMSAAALALVAVLGVTLSREAPAVDFELSSSAALTADAALEHARKLAFEREATQVRDVIKQVMPIVRQTDEAQRKRYLAELEVLGDVLLEAGSASEAAFTYAAAKNLAMDLGLDQTPYAHKRSLAQSQASRLRRAAATRGK